MKIFKNKFFLSSLIVISAITYVSITLGSGTYRPSRIIKPYAESSRLKANFKEIKSFFGTTKSYRHKRDSKTLISYKFIKNDKSFHPESLKPKQYVKLYSAYRNKIATLTGSKDYKVSNYEHSIEGARHKYKIEGEYKRYNDNRVQYYEWHNILGDKMIQIQLITLQSTQPTVTKKEAFEIFQEIEKGLL